MIKQLAGKHPVVTIPNVANPN